MPTKSLEVSNPTNSGKREVFDYPGEYAQRSNSSGQDVTTVSDEGEKVVKIRIEEELSPSLVGRGLLGLPAVCSRVFP